MIHINNVIDNMMMLADYYNLDKNIAYVIASYHDLGLNVDRENHEYESGKILSNDKELKKYLLSYYLVFFTKKKNAYCVFQPWFSPYKDLLHYNPTK